MRDSFVKHNVRQIKTIVILLFVFCILYPRQIRGADLNKVREGFNVSVPNFTEEYLKKKIGFELSLGTKKYYLTENFVPFYEIGLYFRYTPNFQIRLSGELAKAERDLLKARVARIPEIIQKDELFKGYLIEIGFDYGKTLNNRGLLYVGNNLGIHIILSKVTYEDINKGVWEENRTKEIFTMSPHVGIRYDITQSISLDVECALGIDFEGYSTYSNVGVKIGGIIWIF